MVGLGILSKCFITMDREAEYIYIGLGLRELWQHGEPSSTLLRRDLGLLHWGVPQPFSTAGQYP